MPTVFIPAQLRTLAGGAEQVTASGATLRAVFADLQPRFPDLVDRLVRSERLVEGIAVSVDGEFAASGLGTTVGESSEIHFLPAIGGG